MKKSGLWGRIGVVAVLATMLVLSLLTLTACNDKVEVSAIEVVGDTVPGVAVVDEFDISQISLTVTLADGTVQKISAERSMLTAESREALKTPGQKTITLFYNKQTTVVSLFLVESGTETVSVTFLDKDGALLAKRYAVKGGTVVAPTPPQEEGKMFSGWTSSADGSALDLSKVNSSVTVNASYSENTSSYTVTFVDYKNNTISTLAVQHGKKITAVPTYTPPAELQSWKWTVDVNTYVVTNNVTIRMTDIVYKTHTVQYYYAYENQEDITHPLLDSNKLQFSEYVKVNTPALKKVTAQALLSNQGGVALVFVKWKYEPATIAGNTELVAIVKPRPYTISFDDGFHQNATVNVGTTYALPTTAKEIGGWEFNGQWQDTISGKTLTGSVVISAHMNLKPIYNRKTVLVKFTVTFSGILDEANNPVVQVYNIDKLFEDVIDIDFITNSVLPEVRANVIGSSNYQVDTIFYEDKDQTSESVVLTVKAGDALHEFFVTAVDPSLPTSGLVFTLLDSKYTISAYNGTAVNIFVPSTYAESGQDSYPVTAIGADVFKGKTVNISLPNTITEIGSNAFENATFFNDLNLGAISELGVDVFRGAKTKNEKDIKITIGGTLTEIPGYTFYNSKNITEVVIPSSVINIGDSAFSLSDIKTINLANITNIGANAFENSKLANVTSMGNIASVGEYAFAKTQITTIDMPKLSSIGNLAFSFMTNLVAFSVGTELSLEEGEEITFDFGCILESNNILTITIGEGYNKLFLSFNEIADRAMLTETINLPSSWSLTEAQDFEEELAAVSSEVTILGGLFRYIKSINVASGNTVYVSVDGVLYKLSDTYATLLLYPGNRNGDFTMPAVVAEKDVTTIDPYAFVISTINTLTIGENILTLPVFVFAEKIVLSVVASIGLIADNEEIGIQRLVDSFDISTRIYFNFHGLFTEVEEAFLEMVRNNNWENVFILKNGTYSAYNSEYDLVYTVKDNKATIIYGNKKASSIVIPQTIGGYPVSEIADHAFAGYGLLQTLTINATLIGLSDTVLEGCTNLTNITVAGFASTAVVTMSAFEDTKYYATHNVILLGGMLIGYNNFATTKNDKEEIISLTTVRKEDLGNIAAIPDNFFKDSNLTDIALPDSVKTIGKYAFQNCSQLKSINLNKVTALGDSAFAGSGITSIELTLVTNLGVSVFNGCESLISANIPNKVNGGSLPYGTFEGCIELTTVIMPNITRFAENEFNNSRTFANCSSLVDISFINRLGKIPGEAFNGCTAIESIDLTTSTSESIGAGAFKDCSDLRYLVIGYKITTIGDNAFSGCEKLETIRIVGTGGILTSYTSSNPLAVGVFPTTCNIFVSVNAIGVKETALVNYSDKYKDKDQIKTTLPTVSFAMMPNYAASAPLNMAILEDIAYLTAAPQSKTYEGYIFDGWYSSVGGGTYARATFPMLVSEDITLYAKYYSLTKGSLIDEDLSFNEETKSFNLVDFSNKSAVEIFIPQNYKMTVTIGGKQVEGVYPIVSVYSNAFTDCNFLTKIVIPEGVATLGGNVTFNSALEYIYLPASLKTIHDGVFTGLANLDIEFAPNSELIDAKKLTFVGTEWFKEQEKNAEDGLNNGFILAGRLAISYELANEVVTIPSEVIMLNKYLFMNNEVIEELRINDNLRYIGIDCFDQATNLQYVNYVSGNSYSSSLKELNLGSFRGTKWLANQNMVIVGTILAKYYDRSGETTVIIPDGITEISSYAFENVTLSSLQFGANSKLRVIGEYAFRNSGLITVNLPSTVEVLGKGVFQNNKKLTSADLSATKITKLSEELFNGCDKLATLTLSDKVVQFMGGSLVGCISLQNITAYGLSVTTNLINSQEEGGSGLIDTKWYNVDSAEVAQYLTLGKVLVKYVPSSLSVEGDLVAVITSDLYIETILARAFAGSAINTLYVSYTVKHIENSAFINNYSLKSVIFEQGSNLKSIGESAFNNCTKLKEITLPDGLETIGVSAFALANLDSIIIPDSVKHLGNNSFAGNRNMSYVKIGKGIIELGASVFKNCNNLYKVDFMTSEQQLTDIASYIEKSFGIVYDTASYRNYLENLFERNNGFASLPIRMYMDRDSYNFVVNTNPDAIGATELDKQINAWATRATFVLAMEGNYPEITFEDDAGYYYHMDPTEIITAIGKPAKTDSTFVGWYLDQAKTQPLVLPYYVYSPIDLYAKWYTNNLFDITSDANLAFTYNSTTDTYAVSGVVGTASELYIPSTVGGKVVNSINLSANATSVKKLVLTNASNFNSIKTNIFRFFTNLEELVLLDTGTVSTAYKIEDGVVYSLDGTRLISYIARLRTEGENKVKETNFVVPLGVTSIADYAFANSGLTSITIQRNVTKIGYNAFNSALASFVFAAGINILEADRNSFANTVWYNNEITNPARTAYPTQGATLGYFYSAANILLEYKEIARATNLIIPDHLNGYIITTIASHINNASRSVDNTLKMSFANLKLPQSLQRINSNALKDIDITTNIEAGGALIAIADDVFSDTNFYKNSEMLILGKVLVRSVNMQSSIIVPSDIVAISSRAFESSQLVSIILPEGLKTIGDNAFFGCEKLEKIIIPSSVTSIGKNAFANNTSLKTVTFQISQDKIIRIKGNASFVPLIIGEKAFSNCSALTSIEMPPYVTELGNEAFLNCRALKTVTFDHVALKAKPDGSTEEDRTKSKLNSLGSGAFYNCVALSDISIPNELSIIKLETFYNCTSLLNVSFDVNLSMLKTIAERAFYNCNKLGSRIANLNAPDLITVVLPNRLETIKANAFEKCSGMYGMQLNYNLKSVESNVFLGCISLAKLNVYSSTPAVLAADAFKRSTEDVSAYYKLRIYVNISVNNAVKRLYQRNWTDYSFSIYERNELPIVTYSRTVTGAGGASEILKSQEFSADIIINPSHQWGASNYTDWKYAGLDTIVLNETTFAQEIDPGTGKVLLVSSTQDSRFDSTFGVESYQKYEQSSIIYKLLILDHDYTLLGYVGQQQG